MTTPATPTTTAPAAPGTTTPAPAGGRLPNGELRRQVAEALAARAGTELTPRDIAHTLGRSSGAVGNALAALTAGGYAEQTSTKPVRYRSTPTTADAAAAPVAVPSGTPRRPRASRPTPPASTPPASTATPPAPSAVAPVTGPVTRPNGQVYHPRKLSGVSDVTALRKLRDAGVAALMYGPPGTGKTSVIEAAFGDLITIQGDGDTTVADIVGEYTQTPDGKFVFVHGPLVRAMREGRTLFIDDATLISPVVLAVVYPAMDGRRQIIVKANGGEVIDAAPGFYVVAGHNPGVHGAVLTDALASRFSVQIQVSTFSGLLSGSCNKGPCSRSFRATHPVATIGSQGSHGVRFTCGVPLRIRDLMSSQNSSSLARWALPCIYERCHAIQRDRPRLIV